MAEERPADLEDVTPSPGQVAQVPGELSKEAMQNAPHDERSKKNSPLGWADLTGEKRAGIFLALIVLGIVVAFLAATFLVVGLTNPPACQVLQSIGPALSQALQAGKILPDTLSTLLPQCETQQKAFYAFWIDLVQRVLLNALLPVLTALLGYIFGTQQNRTTGP